MKPEEYGDYAPQIDYFIHRVSTPSWSIGKNIINVIDLTYIVNGSSLYCVGEKNQSDSRRFAMYT